MRVRERSQAPENTYCLINREARTNCVCDPLLRRKLPQNPVAQSNTQVLCQAFSGSGTCARLGWLLCSGASRGLLSRWRLGCNRPKALSSELVHAAVVRIWVLAGSRPEATLSPCHVGSWIGQLVCKPESQRRESPSKTEVRILCNLVTEGTCCPRCTGESKSMSSACVQGVSIFEKPK